MNNILDLIKNSPVEWIALGEVTDYEQPTKYIVKSTHYSDEFKTPVLTAGKTFILGYTDETKGIYLASKMPVIIFDDFTTANKWVDFDFKVKSSAMKMITSKNESKVLLKYIFYWLNTLPSTQVDGDHKRQWISNYANKEIPIPPLELQQKIVKVLDKFTELEATLEAELALRVKQYHYFREKLLTFSDIPDRGGIYDSFYFNPKDVVWKSLGEVFEIFAGGDVPKEALSEIKTNEFNIPILSNGIENKSLYGWTNQAKIIKPSLTVSARGTIGWTSFRSDPFFPIVRLLVLTPKIEINLKYAYYFMKTIENDYKVPESGIPQLTKPMIKEIKIPIPPLATQQKIVAILDKFDQLTTSISDGLPREIELRRKQYEYYRERLLGFKKVS